MKCPQHPRATPSQSTASRSPASRIRQECRRHILPQPTGPRPPGTNTALCTSRRAWAEDVTKEHWAGVTYFVVGPDVFTTLEWLPAPECTPRNEGSAPWVR